MGSFESPRSCTPGGDQTPLVCFRFRGWPAILSPARCVWYGSGAPFDPVLQLIAVCSVLAISVVFPLLETKLSDLVNQLSGKAKDSKGARMVSKSWSAIKSVCYGVTGGFLIRARRNEL